MKALCKLDAVELSVRHAIALPAKRSASFFHFQTSLYASLFSAGAEALRDERVRFSGKKKVFSFFEPAPAPAPPTTLMG